MKPPAYSSMEAFLAHYRILRELAHTGDGGALNQSERETLAEMERLAASLTPGEHAALFDSAAAGERARRQQRAELKLRRVLLAHGIPQG
jgi:hypothetical protein